MVFCPMSRGRCVLYLTHQATATSLVEPSMFTVCAEWFLLQRSLRADMLSVLLSLKTGFLLVAKISSVGPLLLSLTLPKPFMQL